LFLTNGEWSCETRQAAKTKAVNTEAEVAAALKAVTKKLLKKQQTK
jgi:hypothetical protein